MLFYMKFVKEKKDSKTTTNSKTICCLNIMRTKKSVRFLHDCEENGILMTRPRLFIYYPFSPIRFD